MASQQEWSLAAIIQGYIDAGHEVIEVPFEGAYAACALVDVMKFPVSLRISQSKDLSF